jgi:ubiquinol-cytochrome c reductase cytochrome b subunit
MLYLTPLALAIWIMDDGTYHGSSVRIATNCFNLNEHEILIKIFKDKYNINTTLHKNRDNYQIYIKKESLPLLIDYVLPYFHLSMYYKLGIK